MKNLKIILALFISITLFNCSSDDDEPTIDATNFTTTIDENPEANAELGSVTATGSSSEALNFSITSQTPTGALNINETTGKLTVADASLFDFETNPTIDAVITISNTEVTATVNATIDLNNIDDIAHFLSTSKADYTAAANGDWIEVTEVEYNALESSLNGVTRSGSTENQYNTTPTTFTASSHISFANRTSPATIIPANHYVFAIKYNAYKAFTSTESKVKLSTTANNSGFSNLGNILPSHITTAKGNVFFVLKGSNTPVSSTGFLGLYCKTVSAFQGGLWYYNHADVGDLNLSNAHTMLYQGLSSSEKQWD